MDLQEQLVSWDNLRLAYQNAARGKRSQPAAWTPAPPQPHLPTSLHPPYPRPALPAAWAPAPPPAPKPGSPGAAPSPGIYARRHRLPARTRVAKAAAQSIQTLSGLPL